MGSGCVDRGWGWGWVGLPVTKLRSRNLQDEGWALFKLVGGVSNKIIILLLFTNTRCASSWLSIELSLEREEIQGYGILDYNQ